MKIEELKFRKREKKFSDIILGQKNRNARVGIIKWCCNLTKKWKGRNYNGKERNLVKIGILRRAQTNQ